MTSTIVHNFCESRLTNYQPPEIYNAYTSLFITFIPLVLGFPKTNVFIDFFEFGRHKEASRELWGHLGDEKM